MIKRVVKPSKVKHKKRLYRCEWMDCGMEIEIILKGREGYLVPSCDCSPSSASTFKFVSEEILDHYPEEGASQ